MVGLPHRPTPFWAPEGPVCVGHLPWGLELGVSEFGQFREGGRSLHEKLGDSAAVLRCRGTDMYTEKMVTLHH